MVDAGVCADPNLARRARHAEYLASQARMLTGAVKKSSQNRYKIGEFALEWARVDRAEASGCVWSRGPARSQHCPYNAQPT